MISEFSFAVAVPVAETSTKSITNGESPFVIVESVCPTAVARSESSSASSLSLFPQAFVRRATGLADGGHDADLRRVSHVPIRAWGPAR